MFAIDDPTAVAVMPTPEAAGTPGYWTEGNPSLGQAATYARASFLNMIQSELLNVVTAAGIAPSKTTYTQLLQALRRHFGGKVRYLVAGSTTLTADDQGIILTDASTGAVNVTLPAASGLGTNLSERFTFIRVDGVSGNNVTVLPAGADLFQPGGLGTSALAANPCRILPGEQLTVASDGSSNWWGGYANSTRNTTFTSGTTNWVAPPFKVRTKVRLWSGGGGGGSATTSSSAGSGGGGGGAEEGYYNIIPGGAYSAVVGAGGTGAVGATNGTAGGASSFGGLISATGGGGGFFSGGGGQFNVGSAGVGAGGYLGFSGQSGGAGFSSGTVYIGGSGGGTFCSSASTGAGVVPGSGGAGGANNNSGSGGARGEIILEF